ncbi:MAG: hypothetical protein LBM06_05600 [Prevotellaceae bacterium]|jgi:hypothetical protein|nr:hypothetical protein [Prevotellaceae bacterium]
MKLSQASLMAIETAVKQAVDAYRTPTPALPVTDLHLQVIPAAGELRLFDDDERLLATAVVEEWMSGEEDNFYERVERTLTTLLQQMKKRGVFDRVSILTPYSFVLVDEEKETLAELLLIDDDTLLLNDELLKGLDSDLDAFLAELLEK